MANNAPRFTKILSNVTMPRDAIYKRIQELIGNGHDDKEISVIMRSEFPPNDSKNHEEPERWDGME